MATTTTSPPSEPIADAGHRARAALDGDDVGHAVEVALRDTEERGPLGPEQIDGGHGTWPGSPRANDLVTPAHDTNPVSTELDV